MALKLASVNSYCWLNFLIPWNQCLTLVNLMMLYEYHHRLQRIKDLFKNLWWIFFAKIVYGCFSEKLLCQNYLNWIIKHQSCHHIETSQLICRINQLTGFYRMATLGFNELKQFSLVKKIYFSKIYGDLQMESFILTCVSCLWKEGIRSNKLLKQYS